MSNRWKTGSNAVQQDIEAGKTKVKETWENKPIVSQFEIEQWVWVFVMKQVFATYMYKVVIAVFLSFCLGVRSQLQIINP